MSFEVKADGVDVARLVEEVRRRVAERKDGVYTDEEVRQVAERPFHGVLTAGEVGAGLLEELRAHEALWNYCFDAGTVYRSSRGVVGRALETARRVLRPVQKLFWNPNPMIAALSRQADLNRSTAHLLHNLTLELTRLHLEVLELRSRNLHLVGRLEALERREKTLECLVKLRDDASA